MVVIKMSSLNKDGNVGDLKKKSKSELLDLLHRQNTILLNRKLLSSLPDRGVRIKKFKEQIEEALVHVPKLDQLSSIFERLQIRQNEEKHDDPSDGYVTSENASESLEEIEHNQNDSTTTHTKNDSSTKLKHFSNDNQPKHFKPHRNARLPVNVKDSCTKPKTWVETAVTPPPARFTHIELLTLTESVELLKKDQKRHQELAQKHAIEALRSRIGMFSKDTSDITFKEYRHPDYESKFDSEDENQTDSED